MNETNEISNLIKELCDIYNRDPHIVNSLKTRTETFDTMRKQGSIFLKDIGDKKQRFFITIPKTKRLGDDILLITIQNSDYSHNDAIAINGDKINRVVDSYQKKGSGLSNYVSRGKFLTQKEVRLKNINPMLQEIKNELQKLYELVKSTYTISPSLEEKINLVETRLAALKTKAQASKYRTDLIPRYKLSPYVIKNINSSGDFINFIPGDKNPFFPNVSIIERRNYLGELQERFAFDKKGFIENYPSKTIKNVPKKIIYMSKSEVSERNLDTNLRKYITKCLQEIDIIP